MPNTPCLVSEGAAGFSLGAHAKSEDRDMVQRLMGAVGLACEVKEPLLDGEACLVFSWGCWGVGGRRRVLRVGTLSAWRDDETWSSC